jgi:hypothetical protein
MDLIIGRFLPPLNSSKTVGNVRRRDDNSRRKVRKVPCGQLGSISKKTTRTNKGRALKLGCPYLFSGSFQ